MAIDLFSLILGIVITLLLTSKPSKPHNRGGWQPKLTDAPLGKPPTGGGGGVIRPKAPPSIADDGIPPPSRPSR